jgi:hypothetical protein
MPVEVRESSAFLLLRVVGGMARDNACGDRYYCRQGTVSTVKKNYGVYGVYGVVVVKKKVETYPIIGGR